MCHWVAGALLPAAGMAGRQHPLCVAYHCKRRGYVWEASWGCVWVELGQVVCQHLDGPVDTLQNTPACSPPNLDSPHKVIFESACPAWSCS